jgi:topoisomerase-4 subunit A
MKRFAVTGITRDKEYDLTSGIAGSTVEYFTANADGAAEVVQVSLRPRPSLRKTKFDVDFAQLSVKGRSSKGNLLTRYMIQKVVQKERGGSTLGAIPIWFDETVRRLNDTGHGRYLGRFAGEDKILAITRSGTYHLYPFALSTHFPDDALTVVKWDPKMVVSAVYWEGEKEQYQVKRFAIEPGKDPVSFITEHPNSKLTLHSLLPHPRLRVSYDKRSTDRPEEELDLEEFISVKGVKALGNRLTTHKVKELDLLDPVFVPMTPELEETQNMLISEDEIGNLDAPEEEDLEESPMAKLKRAQAKAAMEQERHPDDPLIGKSPGKQITLGLDE